MINDTLETLVARVNVTLAAEGLGKAHGWTRDDGSAFVVVIDDMGACIYDADSVEITLDGPNPDIPITYQVYPMFDPYTAADYVLDGYREPVIVQGGGSVFTSEVADAVEHYGRGVTLAQVYDAAPPATERHYHPERVDLVGGWPSLYVAPCPATGVLGLWTRRLIRHENRRRLVQVRLDGDGDTPVLDCIDRTWAMWRGR
jgi:hypothetical protein